MNEFRCDALLILTYGGPESPEEVPLYLDRLFAGRDVSPRAVAGGKARYALIGGKSPIMDEARALAAAFSEEFAPLPVFLGTLYAEPSAEDALCEIDRAGCRRVLVLIASPFGADGVRNRYTECLRRAAFRAPRTEFVLAPPFSAHPKWIRAQADLVLSLLAGGELERIRWEGPDETGKDVLLFTAHSLPVSAAAGYAGEFEAACGAVVRALSPRRLLWHAVYQSRSGPAAMWLGPDAGEFVRRIPALHPGVTDCLVVPIGFFFENLETAADLDLDLAAAVRKENLKYRRAPAVSRAPEIIEMVRGFLADPLPVLG